MVFYCYIVYKTFLFAIFQGFRLSTIVLTIVLTIVAIVC